MNRYCWLLLIVACLILSATFAQAQHETLPAVSAGSESPPIPGFLPVLPFVIILLLIAILPLVPAAEHWWEHNRNKLLVSIVLAAITLLYYSLRGYGLHGSEPGIVAAGSALSHALHEYIPFIILLFALFTISGGISLSGDIPAHPITNTAILAIGSLIASLIGTTGASMLLIRPLLQINSERRYKVHTVVFFIFLVSNIGGCLLPIGDPPLFLGYLKQVPFFWTLNLVWEWLFCVLVLLVIYHLWDHWAYRHETLADIALDEKIIKPLQYRGLFNLVWILGVVICVAVIDPSKPLPGTSIKPLPFIREGILLLLCLFSWKSTSHEIRKDNNFNFTAIGEVACLFIGIFITMQVPIEILRARGPEMGLVQPWQYFWATGALSSFLDNAPTYVVFFETAGSLPVESIHATFSVNQVMHHVATESGAIAIPLLAAVSLGAVFMGANTYIGNGPNFMVRSIAQQAGVKMPSFFGYMLYSIGILIPLFILVTFVFFL